MINKIVIGLVVIVLILCYGKFIAPRLEQRRRDKNKEDWILTKASELHGSQKYGDNPYIYHLRKVLEKERTYCSFFGDDPDLMKALEMAAVFHDTLEDVTGYTYNDLKRDAEKVFSDSFYSDMVAEIVFACTNDKGRNRSERAGEAYFEGIRTTGYAPFIKACDRLANIEFAKSQRSSLYEKYKKEMPEFLRRIENPDNPVPPELKEKLCSFLVD